MYTLVTGSYSRKQLQCFKIIWPACNTNWWSGGVYNCLNCFFIITEITLLCQCKEGGRGRGQTPRYDLLTGPDAEASLVLVLSVCQSVSHKNIHNMIHLSGATYNIPIMANQYSHLAGTQQSPYIVFSLLATYI